jgi:hypothetical protein
LRQHAIPRESPLRRFEAAIGDIEQSQSVLIIQTRHITLAQLQFLAGA